MLPLNSEMDKIRSLDKKANLVNNFIHNLCIFKVRAYRLIDGTLKDTNPSEGTTLLSNITEYHWIYESKCNKLYCLARVGNDCVYFRIRIGYLDQSSMKIVIADSYDELIKNIMSERVYKRYKKFID